MKNTKILFLAHVDEKCVIDTWTDFHAYFRDYGASVFDYTREYLTRGYSGVCAAIKSVARSCGADAVVYIAGPTEFDFAPGFFEELREKYFTVMMLGDTEHYFEVRDRYYAQAMDLTVVNDEPSAVGFRRLGCEALCLHHGVDVAKYPPADPAKKDIDVSFVGWLSGKINRTRYIERLRRDGVDVKTFGGDSPGGLLSFDGKNEIYRRSRINLNFAGVSDTTVITRHLQIHRRSRQLKGRVIEVAAAGGFLLCEYVTGLEDIFELGKEAESFRNEDELAEKVGYYLKHEFERESVAAAGRARALRDYDIKKNLSGFVRTLADRIEAKKYAPSEIYMDDSFARNYSTHRFLWAIRFLKKGKLSHAAEELNMFLKSGKMDFYQAWIFFRDEILREIPALVVARKAVRTLLSKHVRNSRHL